MLIAYFESLHQRSGTPLFCADMALGVFNIGVALNYSIPLFAAIGGLFGAQVSERELGGYIALVIAIVFLLASPVLYTNRSQWGVYMITMLFFVYVVSILIELGAFTGWPALRIIGLCVYGYALVVACVYRNSFS